MESFRNDDGGLPSMTRERFASLRAIVAKPAAPGSMMAYVQNKARIELLAFELGDGSFEPDEPPARGVSPQ